jgi:hypothetical protein
MKIWNSTVVSRVALESGIGTSHAQGTGSKSSIGSLLISDSQIEVIGTDSVLGTGTGSFGGLSEIDDLVIVSSTIVANSSIGYGIGTGHSYGLSDARSKSWIGSFLISNSQIEVIEPTYGSGLGTGLSENGAISRIDDMGIWNSTVVSRAHQGSGIGTSTSFDAESKSSVGSLLISDSHIEAASAGYGSGIGAGYGAYEGLSEIDVVTIFNSTVIANGSHDGSGIGTRAMTASGSSQIRTIAISNSTVIARPGPGCTAIGSVLSGTQVESIHFIGDCLVKCEGSGNSSAIWASSICIAAALLVVITDNAPLFGTNSVMGSGDLIIGYHETTDERSEQLPAFDGAFLHVGHVNVSDSDLGLFRFCVESVEIRHCFDDDVGPIRSAILSARHNGSYSFPSSIGHISRNLIASDGRTVFSVNAPYSFIDVLSFSSNLWTCYFTRSSPLEHVTFAIPLEHVSRRRVL